MCYELSLQVANLRSSEQHSGVFLEHSARRREIVSQLRVLQLLLALGSLIHQLAGIAAERLEVFHQLHLRRRVLHLVQVVFHLITSFS